MKYSAGKTRLKMTPQRAAILAFLEGNTSHPSAEDIFEAIKPSYPMMSLATVYNTLVALKERGHVRELSIDAERSRYDPNTKEHHHIICRKCRKVLDIHLEFKLDVPKQDAGGFVITGRHVEFYGLCERCRTAAT